MNTKREPVAIINAVISIIEATLILLISLEVIATDQKELIMSLVIALAELAKILLTRQKVTPINSPRNDLGQRLIPE